MPVSNHSLTKRSAPTWGSQTRDTPCPHGTGGLVGGQAMAQNDTSTSSTANSSVLWTNDLALSCVCEAWRGHR
jgi:hypothetical protein